MSVDNPFFHRGAIRRQADFFGRKNEIAEILGLLRNGQSVSVIGPRRIGKSSLMLHLTRQSVREPFDMGREKAVFINVDCQELGGSPPEEVYDVIHTGLLDAAEEASIELTGPATKPGTYRALDRALAQIINRDIGAVVLLDEFELLAANEQLTPYFFARLRGLTTKYGLAYITASQRPLYAITADEEVLSSPFFNIFVTLSLGMLSEAEARGLLAQRLEGQSVQFSAELVDHLLQLVGNHPFFLHIAGYHAFQALAHGDGELDDHSKINAAVEIEANSHLSYLWNNLTPKERYSLATTEGPLDAMRALEQQCLITENEETVVYTSDILQRYVRRQHVSGVIQAGPFVIDPQRHQVKVNNGEVALTNSQFDLLACLAQRAGQVVHGEDLERAVWGDMLVDDPDRLKTLIKRLRRAIEPYGTWIVSERGVGYALRPPS